MLNVATVITSSSVSKKAGKYVYVQANTNTYCLYMVSQDIVGYSGNTAPTLHHKLHFQFSPFPCLYCFSLMVILTVQSYGIRS